MEIYQKAIDVGSLAEENYQQLMLGHRELGHHSEALSIYRRFRETLNTTHDRLPSLGMEAFHRELVTDR